MKLKYGYKWLLLSILIVPSIVVLTVLASPTVPSWLSLSGGGGNMASGSHQLMASFGQGQPVGVSSSQRFSLEAGFWNAATAAPLQADVNGDGTVDVADLRIVAAAFGTSPPSDTRADLNGDGVVDVRDLVEVARRFGT